jgi:hypothetical protein
VQQLRGIGNGCRVYTNEKVIDSTFDNIKVSSEYWNVLSFRGASIVNVFKNWTLLAPAASTAANVTAAESYHTVDSVSIGGLMWQYNRMEGLTIGGFPYGILSGSSDIIIQNVWMQNCGWSGGTLTASVAAAIYLTDCSRGRLENINIDNDNAGLTWNSRAIFIAPSAAMQELTIENVTNSLSPAGNLNYYIGFVNSNVSQLFLKNIRIPSNGGGSSFAATSGKYIYQTLTTDN